MLSAIIAYVAVSLLSKKPVFDINPMLHRKADDQVQSEKSGPSNTGFAENLKKTLVGLTRRDLVTYAICIGYYVSVTAFFLIVTVYAKIVGLSDQGWADIQRYFLADSYLRHLAWPSG